MDEEIVALQANKTWELVDLPKDKTPIGCKWVYRVKYHSNGTLERYKARLVAKGFTQIEGTDFNERFSPIVKITTVRTLLALAVACSWEIYQMDVNNAFLQGDLDEDVYMKILEGLSVDSVYLRKVCKMKKSLYSLKQVSRQLNS